MSWKRHVCNLEVPRSLKPPTDHIWIGDDILNHTLHRFILLSAHRRHGSHVPGPLEARRRAAKRRLMNVAPVGAPNATDSGFLAGLRRREPSDFQWQAPNSPTSQPRLLEEEKGKHSFPDMIP